MSIDTIQVKSELEAFLLEAQLIKKLRPFYNIKLIDDKTYPYIEITSGDNQSVTITRKNTNKDSKYFGPYSDVTALKAVLKLIRKIFPYQSVKNHKKRKCLYYHLNLCPCVLANPDSKKEYTRNLSNIMNFLNGKKDLILKDLIKEQRGYIKLEEFEKAQEIQNKVDRINEITSERFEPFRYIQKPNFYFERIDKEVKSLLEIIKPYYKSLNGLERIECYDISNFQGKNATGSMVVFINGHKTPSEYRRFKIKTKSTPDDFHMMSEVLSRRFKKDEWGRPSLIVIDGGKGQVGAALKALAIRNKNIPIIGLAKKEEIIVFPIKVPDRLYFEEVNLSNSTPGINLLRTIRDEAHRFAITYHKNLRKKEFLL